MKAQYVAGKGVYVTLGNQTILLGEHMTILAIEKHLGELIEYYTYEAN